MQRWGIIVTAFYALVVIFLLVPGAIALAGGDYFEAIDNLFAAESFLTEGGWIGWLVILVIIAAQAILFFVSVDTRIRRLKPRSHVALSIVAAASAAGLMCFAAGLCVLLAVVGDDVVDQAWFWIGVPIALWSIWAIVFYSYRQQISRKLDRILGWLLNGSVLQLLIAVPSHLIVRHRNDCSAPVLTGFGIATGIALMLMAFGPSVVFLYQKKLGEYGYDADPAPLLARWPRRTAAITLVVTALALFLLLPYNGPASHSGAIEDVGGAAEQVVQAVEAYARIHSMQIMTPRESFWVMYCNGHVVANFMAHDLDGGARTRWSYLTYFEPFIFWTDYTRFAHSIDELLGRLGERPVTELERPSLTQRIRGRVSDGTVLTGGCAWTEG